jgi:hypothetical protein
LLSPGLPGAVWALAVSGSQLAAGSTSGVLAVWDTRVGLSRRPLVCNRAAHEEAIAGVQFARQGRTIVTSSFDSTVRVWDSPATGAPQPALGAPPIAKDAECRLRATIRGPLLSRCTRLAVTADDTRIVVGCLTEDRFSGQRLLDRMGPRAGLVMIDML